MDFAGVNHVAVAVAAFAAFAFGAVFYGALSKPWMKAARVDPSKGGPIVPLLVNSVVWELVMAFVLAGVIGHLGAGQVTVKNGMISGLFVWIGFLLPSMAINHRYEGFKWDLTIIDGAHWLGVAVIMGAVIGWFGV